MSSKIKVYADAVVKYETNLKEIEKKIAEDGKKLASGAIPRSHR